jgi:hypothetical protein
MRGTIILNREVLDTLMEAKVIVRAGALIGGRSVMMRVSSKSTIVWLASPASITTL